MGDRPDKMATPTPLSLVDADASLFTEGERALLSDLFAAGQGHLVSSWAPPGQDQDGKKRLARQLARLDETTPGGLVGYVKRAKVLLEASRHGENALEGYTPEVRPRPARSHTPPAASFSSRADNSATHTTTPPGSDPGASRLRSQL